MGQVFKGIHEMMGREVAIKVLPLSKATPEAIAKFSREIRTQAQLDHPPGAGLRRRARRQRLLPGGRVRPRHRPAALVRREGKLTMQQAASIICRRRMGLEHAHRRGLIHRDVKPGNILVTPEGIAKVSDLGPGRLHGRRAERSPRGKDRGHARLSLAGADQAGQRDHQGQRYLLAGLHAVLRGHRARCRSPAARRREKARGTCKTPPGTRGGSMPSLSEEFVEIIADMMEKDPKDRVPSAAEVVKRLEPWSGQSQALPTRRLNRSPWTPPPLPGSDDAVDVNLDTDSEGLPAKSDDSPSQLSQTTDPVAAQETTSIKKPPIRRPRSATPPPLPSHRNSPTGTVVAITLAIAVPLSMAVGALLMFVLLSLLNAG
jgi:eukaryotic-like serine/threonine-protein kinase